MPTSTKCPEVRRRRKRWLLGLMIAAVVAGLAWWLIPRPTGLPVRARLDGSEGPGAALAFSPDGLILATGHNSGNIQFWDPATGKHRATLRHFQYVSLRAAFSPDAKTLAVLSANPPSTVTTITIFKVETGREVARIEVPGSPLIPWIGFSPDGSALNLIQWDNSIRSPSPFRFLSWETATGVAREDRLLPLKQTDVLAFTKDGRTAAYGDRNAGAVTLRDVASGSEIRSLATDNPTLAAGAQSLGFSPDGATLAVGRTDGDLELWEVATGTLRARLRGHSQGYAPQMVAFGPARDQIISCGMDWRIPSAPAQFFRYIRGLFRPPGAGRGSDDMPPPEVITWDLASRRPRVRLQNEAWLLLSPDGKTLATTGPAGVITLRDVSTD